MDALSKGFKDFGKDVGGLVRFSSNQHLSPLRDFKPFSHLPDEKVVPHHEPPSDARLCPQSLAGGVQLLRLYPFFRAKEWPVDTHVLTAAAVRPFAECDAVRAFLTPVRAAHGKFLDHRQRARRAVLCWACRSERAGGSRRQAARRCAHEPATRPMRMLARQHATFGGFVRRGGFFLACDRRVPRRERALVGRAFHPLCAHQEASGPWARRRGLAWRGASLRAR